MCHFPEPRIGLSVKKSANVRPPLEAPTFFANLRLRPAGEPGGSGEKRGGSPLGPHPMAAAYAADGLQGMWHTPQG